MTCWNCNSTLVLVASPLGNKYCGSCFALQNKHEIEIIKEAAL